MCSCEISKVFKNTYFEEQLQMVASVDIEMKLFFEVIFIRYFHFARQYFFFPFVFFPYFQFTLK